MFAGACLCGNVRFQITGALSEPRYCHCDNCRKFSGTSPAAWAIANRAALKLVDVDASVTKFNSGAGLRTFCANCGAPVWFESLDYPEIIAVPLGVLEEGVVPPPKMHLWTDRKPDWCMIEDLLPQHPYGPE